MALPYNKQQPGYINIKDYLQANPNVNLGQKISQSYGNELGSQNKAFEQAQSQYSQDLSKANIDSPENRAKREQILSNPEQADQSQLQTFSSFLNPAFAAPSMTGLENQAGITKQMAQDITTPNYRGNLLQRYFGQQPNSPYTLGERTLDTSFLGLPNSSASLSEARRGALQQLGQQQAGLLGAQSQEKAARGQTEQFGKDTQSQLANKIGEYVDETKGSLSQRLKDYQGRQASEQAGLQKGLSTGQFSQQLAGELGLHPGDVLYNLQKSGLDSSSLLSQTPLTLSNVSSPEERARVNALYKLRGETGPLDTTQQTVTPNNLYNLATEQIRNYLTKAGQDYQNALGKEQINIGSLFGQGALAPKSGDLTAQVTMKNAPSTSYYQYDQAMQPFFTLPNTSMSISQSQDYLNRLENTLNQIKSNWNGPQQITVGKNPLTGQQEIQSYGPTTRAGSSNTKRQNVDSFIKFWEDKLAQGKQAIADRIANVGSQYGLGNRVQII